MKILSIETSCDETGLSLISIEGDLSSLKINILEELVATQIEVHREYGGVVPGLARREHEKNLPILFNKMKPTKLNPDLLSVTVGPGLDPCLWSGINYTQKIHEEYFSDIPLVGVNHLEGHLFSFVLDDEFKIKENKYSVKNIEEYFPAIGLVVSGGHTIIIHMRSLTDWEILGQTRDDAVGEAFDKVARLIDLPYPGGPEIEKLSKDYNGEKLNFPEPMIHSKDYDFSYSGLKTHILYHLRDNPDENKSAVAYSFQEAAFAPLVKKCKKAVREYDANSILLSGGVAANNTLKNKLKHLSKKLNISFKSAPIKYNTDNGTIIAISSYINKLSDKKYKLKAQPNLGL
ncbi:MAG TPA: tRNA (adenosine(37)-N6)-threonylcarbamoyltransferase complex transferase subunit TsaD [Candidatus Paceibacterota bacterium]|nr:tRNA (adenosine(37)-N6)-threonylcarbamoyltransferase complex transferase subunit TsaD [Candidatus Paceibacterota bacterium]